MAEIISLSADKHQPVLFVLLRLFRFDVTQTASQFNRSRSLATSSSVFMTTDTACMKSSFSLWRALRFMLMAFVAWFHHGISRQMLMMAGGTSSNAEFSMFFMGKGNLTRFVFKLDNRFIFWNC